MGIGIGDKGLRGRVHGQNSDVIRVLIWCWKEMAEIYSVYALVIIVMDALKVQTKIL